LNDAPMVVTRLYRIGKKDQTKHRLSADVLFCLFMHDVLLAPLAKFVEFKTLF